MDWLTSSLWPIVAALLPTIGLAFMFYVIMKHILEADRRERAAQRAWRPRSDSGAQAPTERTGEGNAKNGDAPTE